MKKNGFTWPYNIFQILTWGIFLTNSLVIFFGVIPSMEMQLENIFLLGFVLISQFSLLILGFEATRSNPQVEILNESEA